MQLGFIGTGEITSSIVTGLCSFGATSHSIRLSPRNATVARELSNRFKGISVASSNQDVLDHSETIVVAVRPAAARAVLSELRFGRDRQIISLVSGLSLLSLSRLVPPATRIARDRKSTRLNSSHVAISYAVFCLKKKKQYNPKR